jgi:hypothetical protein
MYDRGVLGIVKMSLLWATGVLERSLFRKDESVVENRAE